MQTNINDMFRAGLVRRWHTNPDMSHISDPLDGHQGRVARLVLALHPNPSAALLRAALIHDDGEHAIGDLSATCKAKLAPDVLAAIIAVEYEALMSIWGNDHGGVDLDVRWLILADRLDAYMFAAHHAPHILNRDGWPELRNWIESQSYALGCAEQVAAYFRGRG